MSRRSPRGLRVLIGRLAIAMPVAAFGGAMLVRPDLSVIEQHPMDNGAAAVVIATLERHGAAVWVYQGDDWLVRRADTPHVAREKAVVQCVPGSSSAGRRRGQRGQDRRRSATTPRCWSAASRTSGGLRVLLGVTPRASLHRGDAPTGQLRRGREGPLGAPRPPRRSHGHDRRAARPCAHVPESGLSIAMGQARAVVQRQADFITLSNADEGFAHAVETWLLATSDGGQ